MIQGADDAGLTIVADHSTRALRPPTATRQYKPPLEPLNEP